MSIVEGFGLANYRSFAGELQYIGPLKKVNLVIGQNNAGKSNLLRFAVEHLAQVVNSVHRRSGYNGFKPIDQPIGSGPGPFSFAYGMALQGPKFESWKANVQKGFSGEAIGILDMLLSSQLLAPDGFLWFLYESNPGPHLSLSASFLAKADKTLKDYEWASLWSAITKKGRGNLQEHWLPETLDAISPVHRESPSVAFVPAIREVQRTSNESNEFSGKGLIEKLAKLQNPGYAQQDLKKRFQSISTFLQQVTGSESASIEIPADRDTILAHIDGRTLPIESIGTGIHEVIILAAAATTLSGHLVCIEEPEIHLHPLLQRKLVDYLQKSTDNQYLIATHSAHLLDISGLSTFHVRLSDGNSEVRQALGDAEKFRICVDLGYRASDLLQSNCIIWVEGPSDRIYLRNWLKQVAPDLKEGIHYSIMFYGGRLLSHLTADDPEVDDFISLRRLNRFITILIDSDKPSSRHILNATKRRVRDEFDKGPGLAWITAGREIENYIPFPMVERAIRQVHRKVVSVPNSGQFDDVLMYFDSTRKPRQADKVKVACQVVQEELPLDVLDLRSKLTKLVEFITNANGA